MTSPSRKRKKIKKEESKETSVRHLRTLLSILGRKKERLLAFPAKREKGETEKLWIQPETWSPLFFPAERTPVRPELPDPVIHHEPGEKKKVKGVVFYYDRKNGRWRRDATIMNRSKGKKGEGRRRGPLWCPKKKKEAACRAVVFRTEHGWRRGAKRREEEAPP